jgi:hypothetical protein
MGYKLRKGTEEVETQSADNRDFLLSRGYELVDGKQKAEVEPDWMALVDEDETPVTKKSK